MTQDAKIALSAVGTALGLFGYGALLAWSGVRWRVWFPFSGYTLFVFGFVIFYFWSSLRRWKCLVLLVGMMGLHVLGFGYYLASAEAFPWELYFLAPFEGVAIGAVLIGIGGARTFRPDVRERRRPNKTDEKTR